MRHLRRFLTARQWDFCQLQLNYLDTEEQAGLKGYHLAERMGVPVVVMEPVKGGLLAAPPEEVEELLRAARPERTPAGWALRWAASLPGVLTVLSGMGSMAQVEENLATFAGFTPLEPEETELLARAAAELRRRTNNGCTGCEYCMPCPAGVDIPENFSLWNRLARCRDCLPAVALLERGAQGRGQGKALRGPAAGVRKPAPSTCPSGRIWPGPGGAGRRPQAVREGLRPAEKAPGRGGLTDTKRRVPLCGTRLFVSQNHSLGEWYKKAYGDKEDRKTPFAIMKVRSANCTKNSKGRAFRWD